MEVLKQSRCCQDSNPQKVLQIAQKGSKSHFKRRICSLRRQNLLENGPDVSFKDLVQNLLRYQMADNSSYQIHKIQKTCDDLGCNMSLMIFHSYFDLFPQNMGTSRDDHSRQHI
ncbi:hypothetical protein CEXT_497881 [Caerostris extrusa]|uniref:Uncharacterized protein n=1 Tax=Caerostris extrusa TaxID=172846 RepID=A0AAV4MCN0_CAEEX|nr:hypothetical protein CEXT_497881 [Caerostris extrusa]